MNVQGILRRGALAAAAALAVGCGSPAAGVHHGKPPVSAAQRAAIARAVTSECSAYRDVRNQMTGAAMDMSGAAGIQFALALGTDGRNDTWSGAISHASDLANAPRVPEGHNRAREVAVALSKAAVNLSFYQLTIDGNGSWHDKHQALGAAVQGIQSADTACPD